MSYIVSAGVGLVLGIVGGVIPAVLGFIPFLGAIIGICNCLLSPGLAFGSGYIASMFGGIKKDNWVDLAINMVILSVTSTVVGSVLNMIANTLGVGLSIIGGDTTSAALGLGFAVVGFVVAILYTLVLSFIGGAVFLVTGAKK
jgi:hypothetical protein